jgi:hypothetical protein
MTYSNPANKINDLDVYSVANSTGPQSQQILDFLQRFHDLNARWTNFFEDFQEDFITLCAKFQEEIVIKIGPSAKIPGEALLIAHSLRIMALAYKLCEIDMCIQGNEIKFLGFEDSPTRCYDLETFDGPGIKLKLHTEPSQENSIYRNLDSTTNQGIRPRSGADISLLIQEAVQMIQRIIFNPKKGYLSTVFCALYILHWIRTFLDTHVTWMKPISSISRQLEAVLDSLCGLYETRLKGHHPLQEEASSDSGRKRKYASVFDDDELSVAHFSNINDFWVEVVQDGKLKHLAPGTRIDCSFPPNVH